MDIINKTLPVVLNGGISLDSNQAKAFGAALNQAYISAQPFPHIVIDNFLPEALMNEVLAHFPQEATNSEVHYEKGYKGLHKRQISPNECDAYLKSVFAFFNSAPMLQFFESLTSIDGLIPDPYFTGGGLHETKTGGLLGVRADFRVNKKLHVERRINAIIYLNKDWKKEYGGNLELWDTKMTQCLKQVEPIFNRCVVFNTDHDSNHGHPEPLNTPENISRKSIALYYYTASMKVYDEYSEHRTMYKPRPKDKGVIKTIKKLLGKK